MVVEAVHRDRVGGQGQGLWVRGEWVEPEVVGPAGEGVVNGKGPAGEEVERGQEWAAKGVAVVDGEEQAGVA